MTYIRLLIFVAGSDKPLGGMQGIEFPEEAAYELLVDWRNPSRIGSSRRCYTSSEISKPEDGTRRRFVFWIDLNRIVAIRGPEEDDS